MTAEPAMVHTADGTAIATRVLPGDDRCVVAIHGFTGSMDDMVPLVNAVRGERSALVLDAVGHGASQVPDGLEPYSMASVVDQVLSVIGPRLPGTVHLVGYSMGGRIALSAAARAPWYFASVTSLSATAGIADPAERAQRYDADHALADRLEHIGIDAFLDEWLELPLFERFVDGLETGQLEQLRRARRMASAHGLANSLRGTGAGSMPPVWDRLAGLRTPLLAIAGDTDTKYVDLAEQLATTAPEGTAATVDAGHVVHAENLAAVTDLMGPFLESCDQRSSAPLS